MFLPRTGRPETQFGQTIQSGDFSCAVASEEFVAARIMNYSGLVSFRYVNAGILKRDSGAEFCDAFGFFPESSTMIPATAEL